MSTLTLLFHFRCSNARCVANLLLKLMALKQRRYDLLFF